MSDLTGAPNDCFLWNICSEKQKLLRNFLGDRSIHVQFSKLIWEIPYDFLKLSFSISLPRLSHFLIEKGTLNLKFLEPKMRCREKFSLS